MEPAGDGVNEASLAIGELLALLEDAGIEASADPSTFLPRPVGVLVGLPSLVRRGLAARTYEIPVRVVSGDALNTPANVDRLYAVADQVAEALGTWSYAPASYQGRPDSEPLPGILFTVTTTTEEAL